MSTLPDIPPDLVGWNWRRTTAGGALLEAPDGWKTKEYTQRVNKAIDEARRRALSQPKAEAPKGDAAAELEAKILATLPPVPDDLPGWRWEAGVRGLRLANPEEGWVTKWNAPDRERSVIAEARERVAADRALVATDTLSPGMRAHAEDVLALAETFIGRARAAQRAVNELGAGPATRWQPGPDAQGVYRRRPGMAERLMVAPRDLVDGRWQPREAYNQEALDELVESVREHGVLEDLIALVNELDELELITGHRRKRAALAAGGRDVPVKIVEVTLAQATEIAIISNDQRSDLTDLERGRAYEKMIAELDISEAELARRLSRPRAYIQQRRMIATAAPALQKALAAGQLGFTQARAICLGAGGDAEIQEKVSTAALKNIKQGQTVRAEDLQRQAEGMVRERAEGRLKTLGWKMHRVWIGNTSHVYWFAPTAPPEEWSPAEMLAAVKEGRRPPAEGPAAVPFTKEELAALERRGWRVDHTFAPWPAVGRDEGFVFGEQAIAAAAQAAADVAELSRRFAAQGWTVSWKHGSTLIARLAKPKREESCFSYSAAVKLIGQIEKGKYTPTSSSSNTYMPVCSVCRHKTAEHKHLDGQTVCPNCAPPIEARLAVERATIAQALAAQDTGAWLDQAPAFVADLLLAQSRGDWLNPVLGIADGYMEHDRLDQHIQTLTPTQRQAALGAVVAALAWRYRPVITARHLAPAPATAVAPPPDPPEPAAPLTFDALVATVAAIEDRWAVGAGEAGDAARLSELAHRLDDLADDAAIDTAAFEGVQRRLGELLARLDEEGVPS